MKMSTFLFFLFRYSNLLTYVAQGRRSRWLKTEMRKEKLIKFHFFLCFHRMETIYSNRYKAKVKSFKKCPVFLPHDQDGSTDSKINPQEAYRCQRVQPFFIRWRRVWFYFEAFCVAGDNKCEKIFTFQSWFNRGLSEIQMVAASDCG